MLWVARTRKALSHLNSIEIYAALPARELTPMDHLPGARHITHFSSFDPLTYSEGDALLFHQVTQLLSGKTRLELWSVGV